MGFSVSQDNATKKRKRLLEEDDDIIYVKTVVTNFIDVSGDDLDDTSTLFEPVLGQSKIKPNNSVPSKTVKASPPHSKATPQNTLEDIDNLVPKPFSDIRLDPTLSAADTTSKSANFSELSVSFRQGSPCHSETIPRYIHRAYGQEEAEVSGSEFEFDNNLATGLSSTYQVISPSPRDSTESAYGYNRPINQRDSRRVRREHHTDLSSYFTPLRRVDKIPDLDTFRAFAAQQEYELPFLSHSESFPYPHPVHSRKATSNRARHQCSINLTLRHQPNISLKTFFKTGARCTTKIIQSFDTIVVGSSIIGGNHDSHENEEATNQYNDNGGLVAWRNAGHYNLPYHSRLQQDKSVKYYSVNDVAVDPLKFVSSASDGLLAVWYGPGEMEPYTSMCSGPSSELDDFQVNDNDTIYEINDVGTIFHPIKPAFRHIRTNQPLDIHFMPNTSTMAVGYDDGYIQIFADCGTNQRIREHRLYAPEKPGHGVGPLAWGCNRTARHLFASTEPNDVGRLVGYHCFFDLDTQKRFSLNVHESGDALALDPSGDQLALFTSGKRNLLRLYDLRDYKNPTRTIHLPSFSKWSPANEVVTPSFSDDCIFLAVPRSDNVTHIYDSRFFSDPLFAFAHEKRTTMHSDPFGIVNAQWVHGNFGCRSRALVTGGSDGCIRIWDFDKAQDDRSNGRVLAQISDDVAHFSLGDITKQEKRIVVGDSVGGVHIFN